MDSILTSIKKLLGISEDDTSFDQDIIMHINTVFTILTQLGVGPANGFYIEDDSAIWDDFISNDPRLNSIKTYIYMKVRMMFDPPTIGSVADAINKNISELEWRLNATVDPGDSTSVGG